KQVGGGGAGHVQGRDIRLLQDAPADLVLVLKANDVKGHEKSPFRIRWNGGAATSHSNNRLTFSSCLTRCNRKREPSAPSMTRWSWDSDSGNVSRGEKAVPSQTGCIEAREMPRTATSGAFTIGVKAPRTPRPPRDESVKRYSEQPLQRPPGDRFHIFGLSCAGAGASPLLQKGFLRHALIELFQQIIRIKIDADGILGKGLAVEVLLGFLRRGEVVHLELMPVAIRIFVIEGGGRAVIDAPDRRDALLFDMCVTAQQRFQGIKTVRNMAIWSM